MRAAMAIRIRNDRVAEGEVYFIINRACLLSYETSRRASEVNTTYSISICLLIAD